ncbi:MAG: aldose 1-epimerase [Solirubrobacteraceae bacterium]|jgi:galactose mutarotase-like enzyme|nr:aldose 1-epimerase [Solirubrobacteraceae bacterium]
MAELIQRTRVDGHEAVRLRCASAPLEATFVPGVGMVGVSLRDGDAELLGRADRLARYAATGSTMGIPLLYPWANRLAAWSYRVGDVEVALDPESPVVRREEHDLPIHGVLGGSPYWEAAVTAAGLAAELDFGAHPELLAAFPFPHRLRLDVELRDRALTLRTTIVAGAQRPVPVAFGFHPYLRLPGVPRERWRVELPAMRHLELDERKIPTGASTAAGAWAGELGARTFDDGYADVAPGAAFVLAGGGRRIAVRLEHGYPAAQVFAPPTEDVVCFEPMAAPTDALVSGQGLVLVPPGERHEATFSIAVEPE